MSDQTQGGIAWTDETWNPVRGCSRVSKGCEHCYAETVARRFSGPGQPYEGLVRLDADGKAKARWNGAVRFVEEHLGDPLRWTRPRKVFVNSMSDLFHESLPFDAIAAIFGVMAAAPRHTFQVLTKRPKRAREFFAWVRDRDVGRIASDALGGAHTKHGGLVDGFEAYTLPAGGLPNVWLLVSVEDQASADERIPELLACPAAVRGVSYEPALGPVAFRPKWLPPVETCDACGERIEYRNTLPGGNAGDASASCGCTAEQSEPCDPMSRLDWIVVGGESGPGARPFDVAWARSVIAQGREAGVPVFVKQLGAEPRGNGFDVRPVRVNDDGTPARSGLRECSLRLLDRKGGDMSEWPEDVRVREWPRGAR